MLLDSTGLILITGSSHGVVTFRNIWDLEDLLTLDLSMHGAVKCMSFNEGTIYITIDLKLMCMMLVMIYLPMTCFVNCC